MRLPALSPRQATLPAFMLTAYFTEKHNPILPGLDRSLNTGPEITTNVYR